VRHKGLHGVIFQNIKLLMVLALLIILTVLYESKNHEAP
jgi:hypothetical protein